MTRLTGVRSSDNGSMNGTTVKSGFISQAASGCDEAGQGPGLSATPTVYGSAGVAGIPHPNGLHKGTVVHPSGHNTVNRIAPRGNGPDAPRSRPQGHSRGHEVARCHRPLALLTS